MNKRNLTRRLTVWTAVVAVIVMIPLLTKAPWSGSDFIIGAVLLYGCATLYELATVQMKHRNHRIIIALAVLAILIFIWAELAVGIFTTIGS